jgi:CHAT domain-containing protein
VGEVKNGDGVYGLKRALVLASSQSQALSLWQVSDSATRDLMVNYYRRLMAGEGRTEALRQVQLEMIKGIKPDASPGQPVLKTGSLVTPTQLRNRTHPYYWAAFIQSGDWRAMSGQDAVNK